MALQIPTELEDCIRQKIESGRFENETDVLREAMRLLEAREERLMQLRSSIEEGLAAIDRGEGIESTPEVWDEIEREAEERVAQGLQPKPDVLPSPAPGPYSGGQQRFA